MSGCDVFDFEAPQDGFPLMDGLRGANGTTFYPHVSADGILSWTNDGEKPNPAPVDISGPPGVSVELRGPVASVEDLPTSAPSGELWLVGTASPYDGWFYNGARWENAGQIAVGPPGPVGEDGVSPVIAVTDIPGGHHVTITDASGTSSIDIMDGEPGPPGATPDLQIGTVATGEPGSAAEATITGTPTAPRLNLTLPRGQQGPSVPLSDATPLMDGTATQGTGTSAARADHVHPTDTTRAAAAELATYVRPNLLDNWYFAGGGSQLGYGTFPINQRGQTTYSGSGYCIDRFRGDYSTKELSADGLTVTRTGTATWALLQDVSAPAVLGKTITFSALITDYSGNARLQITWYEGSAQRQVNNPITSVGVTSVTLSVPSTASNISAIVWIGAENNYVKLTAVKVEVGSTQTLAHQENGAWVLNEIPNYSDELTKCRRYYRRYVATTVYDFCLNGCLTNAMHDLLIGLPDGTPMVKRSPNATISGSVIVRGVNGYIANPSSGVIHTQNTVANGYGTVIAIQKDDSSAWTDESINNTPIQVNLPVGTVIEISAE